MASGVDAAGVDLSGELTQQDDTFETKRGTMALPISASAAREWLNVRRQHVRSWRKFIDSKRFRAPSNAAECSKRIVINIEHFQSNYLFVFIGLIIFCILTSPLLLIAIAASLGACYIIKVKNAGNRIQMFGHELSLAQQYGVVAIASFPVFYLAGAGSAVFWVLGASFFIIMLHATFYSTEDFSLEEEGFALQMETV